MTEECCKRKFIAVADHKIMREVEGGGRLGEPVY
jgi:hypothetical protein